VAHSISGYGVIVQRPGVIDFKYEEPYYNWWTYPRTCFEFNDFKGYKTKSALVYIGDDLQAIKIEVRDIVAIDASTGLKSFLSYSGDIEVSNSMFYGDENMLNLDCPSEGDPCD